MDRTDFNIDYAKTIAINESALKGRQMIAKFKKGGRIDEERIYDSANRDAETQNAIFHVLMMALEMTEPGVYEYKVGPSMIGMGFKLCAPWEDITEGLEFDSSTGKYKIKGDIQEWKRKDFNRSIPIRVADYVEQPCGTIIVTLESS